MLSLQNILKSEGQEFLDNLFNKKVIVNEKLNAATLSFKKEHTSEMDLNRKLTFYKGSGSNKKEITIADKVITTFYSNGMKYLNNMSKLIIDRIPANWTFVCRYFPNHQPSFINYSVLPKNSLVLSCIITSGGTKIDDIDDLRGWAEMFDIAYQEPVYNGYLTQYQKEKLLDYLKGNNSKESFARFIITMLNPSLTHSLYQNDGFDSPIDGFIFKFVSDDGYTKPISAKLIDPYMTNIITKNKSGKSFKDNTDVLLSDFAVFMSGQDMDSIILTSKTESERYLELFYRLFNRYIKYKKSQLEDFDVDTNDIVKESIDIDFNVNINEITNETTKRLLKDNPEYKNIFKTLLGSFKSKKAENYKSLVMSPGVVRLFNDMVDKITQKASTGEENDPLSFSSYLETIRKKDINTLDINNAPDEIKDANKFKDSEELEIKGDTKDALSFADFKKKDEDKDNENKEKKELKSIEDMIKDLQKNIKDLSNKVNKSDDKKNSDKKSKNDDSKEDDSKNDDKSDEKKKEDKKEDNNDKPKDDNEKPKDDNEKDEGDDKEGEGDDGKDSKKDNSLAGL